jgi:hypothetical protein
MIRGKGQKVQCKKTKLTTLPLPAGAKLFSSGGFRSQHSADLTCLPTQKCTIHKQITI